MLIIKSPGIVLCPQQPNGVTCAFDVFNLLQKPGIISGYSLTSLEETKQQALKDEVLVPSSTYSG